MTVRKHENPKSPHLQRGGSLPCPAAGPAVTQDRAGPAKGLLRRVLVGTAPGRAGDRGTPHTSLHFGLNRLSSSWEPSPCALHRQNHLLELRLESPGPLEAEGRKKAKKERREKKINKQCKKFNPFSPERSFCQVESGRGWIGPIPQELTDGMGCPEVSQVPGGDMEHAREQTNGRDKSS